MGIQESGHLFDKSERSGSDPGDRRGFLKAAAIAGVGLVVGSTGTLQAAEDEPAPLTTPVHELGFSDDEVKLLTDNVKKLSKGDLHDMREAGFEQVDKTLEQFLAGYKTKGGLTVKVEDIVSLHKANSTRFVRVHHAKGTSVKVCCCCSPCCSCTASVVTKPLVARVA